MESSVRKIKVDGHDFFGYVVPGSLVFAALIVFVITVWGNTPFVLNTLGYLGPTPTGGDEAKQIMGLKAFHYIGVSIIIIIICHVLGHIVATFASLLFDQILIGKIIKSPHERFVALCDLCTVTNERYEEIVKGMRRGRSVLSHEDIRSGFSGIHYRALFSFVFVAPLLSVLDTCPAVKPAAEPFTRLLGCLPLVQQITLSNAALCILIWFPLKWISDGLWNQLSDDRKYGNTFLIMQQLKYLLRAVTSPLRTYAQLHSFCGSFKQLLCLLFVVAFTVGCGFFALPMYLIGIVFENLADLRKAFPLVAQLRFKEKYKKLFCVKNTNGEGNKASDFHSEIWWAVYWYVLTTNDVIRERVEKFHTLYRFMRNCGLSCLVCVPLMAGLATRKQPGSWEHAFFAIVAIAFWLFACLFVLRYCYIYNNFFAKTVYRAFAFLPDPDPVSKAAALCVRCGDAIRTAEEKDPEQGKIENG